MIQVLDILRVKVEDVIVQLIISVKQTDNCSCILCTNGSH